MISQTAEYALRAVVFLIRHRTTPRTRAEIAVGSMIPVDYLTRVLKRLSTRGIVTSRRGPGGGYMIAPDSEDLTVYAVVDSVSAVPRIENCPLGLPDHEELCPLHAKLDEAAALVEKCFRETRVADLIPKRRRTKKSQCAFPPSAQSTEP